MQKNYCDRCGKELKGHEGHFLKFNKSFTVDFIFHFRHEKEIFDTYEVCADCWEKLMKLYDKFMKEGRNAESKS